MVQAEELLQLLRQRPFRPFLLHLSDGRVLEVRFPGDGETAVLAHAWAIRGSG